MDDALAARSSDALTSPEERGGGESRRFEDNGTAKLTRGPHAWPGGMIDGPSEMPLLKLHKTVGVRVGPVQVGGGAPVVVQSMTMTDTADAEGTSRQCI